MKKVMIVEDEAIIAAEIEFCCQDLGYNVIGKYRNGDNALDAFKLNPPDIALLDINIKGSKDGVDLAKIIRSNYNFPFVFLTSYADVSTLERVREVLPYGYILKPFSELDLRSNIEIALFKWKQEQIGQFPSIDVIYNKSRVRLTDREHQLFKGLYDGLSNKGLAEEYFISINTVKTYLKTLFTKLDISSRHEAVKLALKLMKP